MKIHLLILSLVGSFFLAACSGSRPDDTPRPPRLAVVLVVDQMRADYLTRFAPHFSGGLARISQDGTVFTNAHQDHAITETAPGHATISTGVFPGASGIIGNSWWSSAARRTIYAVEDTIPILGVTGAPGSSPANLLRPTIGAWLKQASPSSKVYAVSSKDRSALLLGGRQADAAYWFMDQIGQFVTSSHYLDQYPRWVHQFNGSGQADAYQEAGWTKLYTEATYANTSREDAFASEKDGVHNTFPHAFPPDTLDYYAELYYTPFGDALTLAFARELIQKEKLGSDSTPDLLLISASSADGIGHAYGPFSQEVQDYYLRLDRMLDGFIDFLDREVGRDAYVLTLTADHGVLPMPEELQRRGENAKRISLQRVLGPAIERTRKQFDIEKLPVVFATGLALNVPPSATAGPTRPALRQALAQNLRELDEIADVFTYDELLDSNTPDRPYLSAYRNSFNVDRSPDLMLRFNKNILPIPQKTFTSHGTPYAYDTHVPLIFFGAQLPPVQYDARVRTVDIAPTLADLLQVTKPAGLDGEALTKRLISLPPPLP